MTRVVSSHNCYVIKGDQVLMFHRAKHVPRFPDFWMGPGGRQEPFEDVLHSCVHHVNEETGIRVKNIRLRIVATHHYPHKDEIYLVFIFMADYAGGELKEYSRGEPVWVEKNKLLELDKLYSDLYIHLPLAFEESDELYFTHMEFDQNFEVVKAVVRISTGIVE